MTKLILAFLMAHNSMAIAGPAKNATQTPEMQAVQLLKKTYGNNGKTSLKDLVEKSAGQMPTELTEHLRKEIKGQEKTELKYEFLPGGRMVMKTGNHEVVFEFLSMQEGTFKVNNKVVKINFNQKPENLMNDIQNLFPNSTASLRHPLLKLLMPEAEAVSPWVIALGVGLATWAAVSYNKSNCATYANMAISCNACLQNSACNRAEEHSRMKTWNSGWFNIAWFCKADRTAFNTCMSALNGAATSTDGALINGVSVDQVR